MKPILDQDILQERQDEWKDIEDLVFSYKKQFNEDATYEDITIAKRDADILLQKFLPLFKKYILLLKTGQIDFKDSDIKLFVGTFIDDPRLHRALKRQKSKNEYRANIYKKFGFVLETYGKIPETEMLTDMELLLLILAKRYKQIGKNFCAYVHNCFRYEVSRHIKKYIKNPLNITYKLSSYEDRNNGLKDDEIDNIHEDIYYESDDGIPNLLWISGETCGDVFNVLSSLERKILVKYYSEELNDKQIAEILGIHINIINQKRRQAVSKIAATLSIDLADIKRNRHSGKKIL